MRCCDLIGLQMLLRRTQTLNWDTSCVYTCANLSHTRILISIRPGCPGDEGSVISCPHQSSWRDTEVNELSTQQGHFSLFTLWIITIRGIHWVHSLSVSEQKQIITLYHRLVEFKLKSQKDGCHPCYVSSSTASLTHDTTHRDWVNRWTTGSQELPPSKFP